MKIDWGLLETQKLELVKYNQGGDPPSVATIEGIIGLIDYLQDEREEKED